MIKRETENQIRAFTSESNSSSNIKESFKENSKDPTSRKKDPSEKSNIKLQGLRVGKEKINFF